MRYKKLMAVVNTNRSLGVIAEADLSKDIDRVWEVLNEVRKELKLVKEYLGVAYRERMERE